MALVPKYMHFIWIGTVIPQKYVDNIQEWQRQNPDYKACVWVDSGTVPPQFEKDGLTRIQALTKAREAGAEVIDIGAKDNPFLQRARNARWYNEEATGHYANLAAASDILRLDILEQIGGVYIDTDVTPGIKPLGDIDVEYGFAKPMNYYNDVMCAVPGSALVKEFIDELDKIYRDAYYKKDDLSSNIELELHRHFRPWKNRVASTLDMSGIGPIVPVIQRKIDQIRKDLGDEAAVRFSHAIFNKPLADKFTSHSDQTWIDKGPQSLQEQHVYFREEFKCRLKRAFLESLQRRLVAKKVSPEKISAVMAEVSAKLLKAPELMSIAEVIRNCSISTKKGSSTRKVVAQLVTTADQIEQQIAGLSFTNSDDLHAARRQFFPQFRYQKDSDKDTLNLNLSEQCVDLDECAKKINALRLA